MDNFSNFYQFFFRQGRLFKWLPVKSKNKLIFHALRFQSYDFLTDLNQVDKCCILLISKLKKKKNLNSPHRNTLSVAQFSCMMSPKAIIFSSTESLPTKGQHLKFTVRCVNFPFFPPLFPVCFNTGIPAILLCYCRAMSCLCTGRHYTAHGQEMWLSEGKSTTCSAI